MFEEMKKSVEDFFDACERFAKEHTDEEDYFLEWEEFHKKHPLIPQHEYDMGVKKTQEM